MAEFAGCVVHHRTQSPNKIDAFMTCVRAGLTVTHDVVGSFSPSLVEKTIITTEDSKRMTTRVTDTWLGDCE